MKTLENIVHYRRSVRHYQNKNRCRKGEALYKLATLSPILLTCNCGNFTTLLEPNFFEKLFACLTSQEASNYCKTNGGFRDATRFAQKKSQKNGRTGNAKRLEKYTSEKQEKQIKRWQMYYGKVMPFLYSKFLGILGFRKILVNLIGPKFSDQLPIKFQKMMQM